MINTNPSLPKTPEIAWLILGTLPHWGPVSAKKALAAAGGDVCGIFRLNSRQLTAIPGIGPEMARVLKEWPNWVDPGSELAELNKRNGFLLHWDHPDYPRQLLALNDPPIVLRGLGRPPPFPPGIAVVGTRRPSAYGQRLGATLAKDLSRAGILIISGLASGVDAIAHQACLEEGGWTLAVLGCGLLRFFPPELEPLYGRIAVEGTVLSEFPLYRQADRQTFPIRNRIVSGLSRGVLVVESQARGGSLITAEFAGKQGRQIYALPGRIDQKTSEGCHQLIRDGAQLVTRAEDILEDLALGAQIPLFPEAPPAEPGSSESPLAPQAQVILRALAEGDALGPDDLAGMTGIAFAELAGLLLELELAGRVTRNWEGRYEST